MIFLDDSTALKNCLGGDRESFSYFVERYQNQAVSHATAILGNCDKRQGRDSAGAAARSRLADRFPTL
jgi:hypothetical protein